WKLFCKSLEENYDQSKNIRDNKRVDALEYGVVRRYYYLAACVVAREPRSNRSKWRKHTESEADLFGASFYRPTRRRLNRALQQQTKADNARVTSTPFAGLVTADSGILCAP
ncbi:hypothetical protein GWI33_001656, partial [Rhynchophorus ferrugineus]